MTPVMSRRLPEERELWGWLRADGLKARSHRLRPLISLRVPSVTPEEHADYTREERPVVA